MKTHTHKKNKQTLEKQQYCDLKLKLSDFKKRDEMISWHIVPRSVTQFTFTVFQRQFIIASPC